MEKKASALHGTLPSAEKTERRGCEDEGVTGPGHGSTMGLCSNPLPASHGATCCFLVSDEGFSTRRGHASDTRQAFRPASTDSFGAPEVLVPSCLYWCAVYTNPRHLSMCSDEL